MLTFDATSENHKCAAVCDSDTSTSSAPNTCECNGYTNLLVNETANEHYCSIKSCDDTSSTYNAATNDCDCKTGYENLTLPTGKKKH